MNPLMYLNFNGLAVNHYIPNTQQCHELVTQDPELVVSALRITVQKEMCVNS